MSKFELYGLYCPNTDMLKYIGITKNGLKKRLSSHISKPTNPLMKEWLGYLKNLNHTPNIKLIKECSSYDDLLESEFNEIKKLKTQNFNLLNVLDGGNHNPMLGKTHTDKTKKLISIKNKGKKITEETKRKIKETNKKLYWDNDVWLKKKSLSNSGENNPFFGKNHSKESIEKLKNRVIRDGGFKHHHNPNFKFDITKEYLTNLYLIENKTIKEISNILKCSINTVNNNLRKYDINKPKSNIYNLNKEQIIQFLLNGLNYVEIGKKYGCSNKIIHKFIKKNNLYVK